MAETHYWMVRPGKGGRLASQFISMRVIAIGWNELGPLTDYGNREEIKQQLKKLHPDNSPSAVGKAASELYRFGFEILPGDIVVVPMQNRTCAIGRVSSQYIYDPSRVSTEYPHLHEIEWIRENVSDAEVWYQLRANLEPPNEVTNLDQREADIEGIINPRPKRRGVDDEQGLSRIHFERFKAFSGRFDVEVASVNVIAGVNSAGKSTIIQSLLLIRQTLITPYRSAEENALVLAGDLVDFPNFHELIFGKPDSAKGDLWFGLAARTQFKRIVGSSDMRILQDVSLEDFIDDEIEVDLNILVNYDRDRKVVAVSKLQISLTSSRVSSIPISFICEPTRDLWRISLKSPRFNHIWTTRSLQLDRFFPFWRAVFMPDTSAKQDNVAEHLTTILFRTIITGAIRTIRDVFEQRFFYIGPVRSSPQRVYLHRSLPALDVGPSGEYAVQQLFDHREDRVSFVNLPTNLEDFHPFRATINERLSLNDAVSSALRLLGMEQQLKIQRNGDIYTAELSLHNRPKTFVSITDVGFGVSQILPIITLGLLSPRDSLLVFEQPEIHLHPRAQAGLADLLLCLARLGRRFVIETHSDYLVNRFRRRAAEDLENNLDGLINILFVCPPDANHESARVERAQINRHGEIDNWPDGFLTDSAFEARETIMAGSEKRLKEQGITPPSIRATEPYKPRRIPE